MSKTAEQYRADASAQRAEVQASWERSDTDGFLSQWAGGLNAQLSDQKATIAEQGGRGYFERTKLTSLDGTEIADARVVETRYGTKWRIDSTDQWLAYQPARESTLAKKGYREETEGADLTAVAFMDGKGKGLSGSAWVAVFTPDRPKSEGWRYRGAPQG